MKNLLLFVFLSFFITGNHLMSQDTWCGFDDTSVKEYYHNHPEESNEIKNQYQFFLNNTSTFNNRDTRIIPVVVHVIHDGDKGNISDEQIQDALDVINRDFNAQSTSIDNVADVFKPVIADLDIEFKLAKIDPNGNCTNGIVRVDNPETSQNGLEMNIKSTSRGGSSQWDPERYFNFWVVNSIESNGNSVTIGYARFPIPDLTPIQTFGLVMRADHMGTIEEASSSDGTVLTHEIGHCFGLFHTFNEGFYGEGCNAGSCFENGDLICDTPPATSTSSCEDRNTCDIVPQNDYYGEDTDDMKENFMAYSNGCLSMFTLGQKARMETYLTSYVGLRSLYTQANIDYTAINTNGTICNADFSVDNYTKCLGDEFFFSDISYSNVIEWNWDFGVGAQPQYSNDKNPSVIYSNAGQKNVTLVVSDGVNSLEVQKTIEVLNFNLFPYFDDLSSYLDDDKYFISTENESKTWGYSSEVGYNDFSSLYLNNFINSESKNSYLSLKAFDLSNISEEVYLSFMLSFAIKSLNDNGDYLFIEFSNNCGESWSRIYNYTYTDLFTAYEPNSEFKPSLDEQWKKFSLLIPEEYKTSGFGIRFVHNGGKGNDLYLDDILISTSQDNPSLGLDDRSQFVSGFKVYPNPTKNAINLEFDLLQTSNVEISLKDLLGRNLKTIETSQLSKGRYDYKVDLSSFTNGIYFFDMNVDGKHQLKKIIIE